MSLQASARIALVQCLAVKPKETVLIVCDKKAKKIADAFFKEARLFANKAILVTIPVGKIDGQEPPQMTARIMQKCNVAFLITTKSLTHTNARKQATKKGVRVASMPGITEAMTHRCFVVDYAKMMNTNKKISSVLSKARTITVQTSKGTHFTFARNRKFLTDDGLYTKKGEFGNLPAGEVFVAPQEGSANGVLVFDASMGGIGRLNKPIRVFVRNGSAIAVSDKRLAKILKPLGKTAFNIAEFGIGTNPKAKITGKILEDEKAISTCHAALGNSSGIGGRVYAKCHLDGIIKNPTIHADKKLIMKNGKILV